ncbi:MAG TPA: prepilin peptidase [Candidatus Margulisbacteria bacterium]|nr:MAG: hypothetical protein A2X43_12310 [Candidatus Margulisbacteria bacterium GWD2_39_127]OGI03237.1 MAG: hypothetical protein A2X42_11550 [Candidatus Margulisbacteria bacterium GWF2_38_17]OGI11260.1 MAG: hypothetical protein A2X41_03975 [Candidatus Margulisbacteria bacterium GWE2_39_32]HAR63916.1 prepilin peptidase [Candidatus Margulisiibacteriota bacterium]HCT85847.1 prepilin peptidase [Candidatus Margulisiibacteriota bacterium]
MDVLIFSKVILVIIIITISVITDLATRKIYNILTLPAICSGLLFNMIYFSLNNFSLRAIAEGFIFSFSGLIIALIVFFILFAFGWFGGGDAKLMGAIGAFMGSHFIIWCILYTLIAGGICSFFLIINDIVTKRKRSQIIIFFISLKNKLLYRMPLIFPDKKKSATFTYSIAIAMGFVASLLKFNILKIPFTW